MARTCPFRDINVHASSNAYTFSSPSSPHAHALVIQRPTGDIRTQDAKSPSGQRMYSIYGILGMITLRLGINQIPYISTIADHSQTSTS